PARRDARAWLTAAGRPGRPAAPARSCRCAPPAGWNRAASRPAGRHPRSRGEAAGLGHGEENTRAAAQDGAVQPRSHAMNILLLGATGHVGSALLQEAPGVELVDVPDLPEQWRQTALATRDVLLLLRQEDAGLQWPFLSPPMLLEPGPRTGRYRLGGDALL